MYDRGVAFYSRVKAAPPANYVHIGCGFTAPAEWMNFDVSPTLRAERLPIIGRLLGRLAGNPQYFPANVRHGDIIRGLPLPDGTVSAIYASHVLEHLAFDDLGKALDNCFRMLRPGGVLRLVVPDLEARARAYLESRANGVDDAGNVFLERCGLGTKRRPRRIMDRLRATFGNSAHLWMWDEGSMREALLRAGFRRINRVGPRQWADPMFTLVEDDRRLTANGAAELTLEATKV